MPKRLIVLFIVLLSSYAFAKKDDNAVYEITAVPHEGYEVKDNAIYYRLGNGGMIFELADNNILTKYYADRGASRLGNPFLQSPDLANATVFLVTLINRSNGSLTFTPGYVVMKVGDASAFPLDFSMLLSSMEVYPPAVHKILEQSIFYSPETVRPGKVVSKFLLYPPLPRKNIDFRLDIDYLYFEDKEVRRTSFRYTIRKKKE